MLKLVSQPLIEFFEDFSDLEKNEFSVTIFTLHRD